MVRDTPPSQDASTHQIWNSYLKEYRRSGPDTKAGRTHGQTHGRTDGRTVRLLYASQSSFGGIKTDQSLMGTLWVAKGPIFLIKTDQSLIGHSMGSQMSNISNKN